MAYRPGNPVPTHWDQSVYDVWRDAAVPAPLLPSATPAPPTSCRSLRLPSTQDSARALLKQKRSASCRKNPCGPRLPELELRFRVLAGDRSPAERTSAARYGRMDTVYRKRSRSWDKVAKFRQEREAAGSPLTDFAFAKLGMLPCPFRSSTACVPNFTLLSQQRWFVICLSVRP